MIVFLDSSIVGLLSSPKKRGEARECKQWLYRLLARGIYVTSSDLCDYEVRRSLLLNKIKNPLAIESLDNLDELQERIEFLPLSTLVMRQASLLWAETRSQAQPTAALNKIDADVIIGATCQLLSEEYPGQYLVAATTNVKHLSRFIESQKWTEINI
jgi:hypothetical protein